ncbi:hypothetical protein [Vibrio phage vB_pir03]|nr:hypothetical protein [Vibrio phage vB_pir03]
MLLLLMVNSLGANHFQRKLECKLYSLTKQ